MIFPGATRRCSRSTTSRLFQPAASRTCRAQSHARAQPLNRRRPLTPLATLPDIPAERRPSIAHAVRARSVARLALALRSPGVWGVEASGFLVRSVDVERPPRLRRARVARPSRRRCRRQASRSATWGAASWRRLPLSCLSRYAHPQALPTPRGLAEEDNHDRRARRRLRLPLGLEVTCLSWLHRARSSRSSYTLVAARRPRPAPCAVLSRGYPAAGR